LSVYASGSLRALSTLFKGRQTVAEADYVPNFRKGIHLWLRRFHAEAQIFLGDDRELTGLDLANRIKEYLPPVDVKDGFGVPDPNYDAKADTFERALRGENVRSESETIHLMMCAYWQCGIDEACSPLALLRAGYCVDAMLLLTALGDGMFIDRTQSVIEWLATFIRCGRDALSDSFLELGSYDLTIRAARLIRDEAPDSEFEELRVLLEEFGLPSGTFQSVLAFDRRRARVREMIVVPEPIQVAFCKIGQQWFGEHGWKATSRKDPKHQNPRLGTTYGAVLDVVSNTKLDLKYRIDLALRSVMEHVSGRAVKAAGNATVEERRRTDFLDEIDEYIREGFEEGMFADASPPALRMRMLNVYATGRYLEAREQLGIPDDEHTTALKDAIARIDIENFAESPDPLEELIPGRVFYIADNANT